MSINKSNSIIEPLKFREMLQGEWLPLTDLRGLGQTFKSTFTKTLNTLNSVLEAQKTVPETNKSTNQTKQAVKLPWDDLPAQEQDSQRTAILGISRVSFFH